MGEKRVGIALHTPMNQQSPPPLAPSRGKFKQHAGLRTQGFVAGAAPYSGHFLLFRKVCVPQPTLVAGPYDVTML